MNILLRRSSQRAHLHLRPRLVDLDLRVQTRVRLELPPRLGSLLLITILAVALSLGLIQLKTRADGEVRSLQAELTRLKREGTRLEEARKQAQGLEDAIKKVKGRLDELQQARASAPAVKWADILRVLTQSAPAGLSLETVTQEGSRLTITGTARDFVGVVQYGKALRQPQLFSSVSFQRITVPQAVATPRPGTPISVPSGTSFLLILELVKGGGQ